MYETEGQPNCPSCELLTGQLAEAQKALSKVGELNKTVELANKELNEYVNDYKQRQTRSRR